MCIFIAVGTIVHISFELSTVRLLKYNKYIAIRSYNSFKYKRTSEIGINSVNYLAISS